MIAPPRFATWLVEATLPPSDADTVCGDLCEEFTVFILPQRGKLAADFWYCWQVARSLGPIVLRTWQRATVTRATVAIMSAALAATVPAIVLVLLRTFTLRQVPLKTTAEASLLFAAILAAVIVAGIWLGAAVVISCSEWRAAFLNRYTPAPPHIRATELTEHDTEKNIFQRTHPRRSGEARRGTKALEEPREFQRIVCEQQRLRGTRSQFRHSASVASGASRASLLAQPVMETSSKKASLCLSLCSL